MWRRYGTATGQVTGESLIFDVRLGFRVKGLAGVP